MIVLRPARYGDAEAIGSKMRLADMLECLAFGHTPTEALDLGFRASFHPKVAEDADGPFAGFGVTPESLLDGVGRPWLLGTPRLSRHRRALVRLSLVEVEDMQRHFPRLRNYVMAENAASIRLLRHLGFAIEDETADIGGFVFRRFSKGL